MFDVRGGGYVFTELTAHDAASKARALRYAGINDVEIFRVDDIRISQYLLDQVIHAEAEKAADR